MKRIVCLVALVAACSLPATQPPDAEAIKTYLKDGTFEARAKFVKETGNHRLRQDLAQRALARLQGTAGRDDPAEAPLPGLQGMPTKGTNQLLVLLIDFPDYAHVNEASLITSKLFGDGSPAEFPKESLRNYYLRSSYNQLHLQGKALGWYRMQHPRNWYTTQYPSQNEANRAIILEVLQAFDAANDFSVYDNDGNGVVDYFAVIWAGPDTGWGNFWWGYQWQLFNPITLDGVSFATFSWQWESRPVGAEFEAETIIHETGHALGLPDYYDYDPSQGPDGGVGGLDMMDGNYADHNAFSKFVLEWLTPTAIEAGSSNLTLRALGQSPEAVAIMPDFTGGSAFTEYFIVENRFRTNNDTGTPANGLLVWHVDATPNDRGEDFLYDNSYTPHKLLRLMEADGLEEIEFGDGRADAGDYYNQGEAFGQDSFPNSRAYSGYDTGVTVDMISPNAYSMNLRLAVEGTSAGPRIRRSPSTLSQITFEGSDPGPQVFGVWASGGALAYAISDDAAWVAISPDSGSSSGATNFHTLTYNTASLSPGTYSATLTLTAPNATNSPQSIGLTLTVMGGNIGRAVDNTNFAWIVGGNSYWFEQTSGAHDGVDAAQSGSLANGEANWIEATVQGPGQLSFWWKVSSELGYDFLRFTLDGTDRVQPISGATEWQPNSLFVPHGVHTLRWTYAKDFSIAAGTDAGWVDQVEFVPASLTPTIAVSPGSVSQFTPVGQDALAQTIQIYNGGGGLLTYTVTDDAPWLSVTPANESSSGAPNQHQLNFSSSLLVTGVYTATITISSPDATNSPTTVPVSLQVLEGGSPLAEAVDFPATLWNTGGDAVWQAQTVFTHDGTDAAASGQITHGQYTWIETTVEGPGLLSFWWKASTEAGYDYLDCLLDQDWTGLTIDGESDWRQEFLMVPTGEHTLTWVYSKDGSVHSGYDQVWLDQVSFAPGGGVSEVLLSTDFVGGQPSGWQIVDNAFSGVTWQFYDACARGNFTGGSGEFAIADSDCAGFAAMDTELVTPSVNCFGYTNVALEFKSDLDVYSFEYADVDVRINGGGWQNLWRRTAPDYGPKLYHLPLPQADNQASVQVRFHYYNAYYDWFWSVDDVTLLATSIAPPRDYLADWRQAWEDFDRHYPFFTPKGIDWQAVYDANTNRFANISNAVAFAEALSDVLQLLNDWQVAVQKPDGSWLAYDGSYSNNHPAQPFASYYTVWEPYQNLNNADTIFHAWVYSNLAHLVVTRLDETAFAAISDADLDGLFATYQTAHGLILDLRPNLGGNEANAFRLASRFTGLPRAYGYTRTRIAGNDHDALTPFAVKILNSSAGMHFTNKVACLIGQTTLAAAEWFALMMKTCPQVTLIGDRTRGASSDTELFTQTSSGVSYLIPRRIGYTASQSSFEESGISPYLALPPGEGSYDEWWLRDYVLERAIAWLRRPQLAARAGAPSELIIEWLAAEGSTYTLLRSTNPASAPWTLAPDWVENQPGFHGLMSYTNTAPTGREFYKLLIGP